MTEYYIREQWDAIDPDITYNDETKGIDVTFTVKNNDKYTFHFSENNTNRLRNYLMDNNE